MGFVKPHGVIAGRIAVAARLLLGFILVIAGTAHLVLPRETYLAQIPSWMPVDPAIAVIFSGILEIVLGLLFITAVPYQRQVGIAAALFFILVYPGVVANYVEHARALGNSSDLVDIIRLFLQPLVVVWVLWCTRALSLFR